ncbi:MAG: hypothetical protein HON68_03115 [Gammaproteobacteria bacterium]|jgi:hypothetical protein|nr:hypothetical protein [Gammaproteobacteria bacterium]MBT3490257.1 hypothetical protein [Gammaproteobacteria bacterium]MBT3719850.1 hypothetical protein [Gammaproteobacteria bacterium]MBT3845698.1 hypothetical protein [Gammaproteobacteria bacterium]MBT3893137.1 hypothetical protein [Gammaproteobacteria bacterium]
MNSDNKDTVLMESLVESVSRYADNNMTETLKIRTDYLIAQLVSELKDVIEYNNSNFVPTESYLQSNVFPAANLMH